MPAAAAEAKVKAEVVCALCSERAALQGKTQLFVLALEIMANSLCCAVSTDPESPSKTSVGVYRW